MVLCSVIASKIAKTFGRVQTIILVKAIGLSCLYCMILIPNVKEMPWLVVPLYIARTGIMNCTYPLQESILMDFVPKCERARWKSLESVSAFGWCGSAALGGVLADHYDYTFTFLITALLQSLGTLGYFMLVPLVPRIEAELEEERKSGGGGMNRPLLEEDGEAGREESLPAFCS